MNKAFYKTYTIILICALYTFVFSQVTPGSSPKRTKSYDLSLDSLSFINHNIAGAFMNSTFSLISPSTASPVYYGQQGLPVYADVNADPVTGKFNYQQQAPAIFFKAPDSSALHKPFTDIFYKEGGYDDTRLSAFQWLPLNNTQNITIKINSHKSYSEYYKTNSKEQIAAVDLHYQKELPNNSQIKTGFSYFRNVGHDFTGTRPVPDLYYISGFTKNYYEDYFCKYSLQYINSNLDVEIQFSNIKNKANDIFYKAVSDYAADTISRNLSLQQENLSINARYKINSKSTLGVNTQNFRVYKSKVVPKFKHYYLETFLNSNYAGFISTLKLKKADLYSWMFDINVAKKINLSHQSSVTAEAYYRTFILPYTYSYFLKDANFNYNKWQKVMGGKLSLTSKINNNLHITGYSWINIPVDYYSQFYIKENYKIKENYFGGGISLKLLTKYFKSDIFYENYSPFGSDYIQKIGCKGKLDLKLSSNIRISGYALLMYYLNYQKTNFFYTTNEFHFYSTEENPVITNLYLTLPVKSSILFVEWSNVLQQDYAFKNYDYFSFVTFKFGVIWRLWE